MKYWALYYLFSSDEEFIFQIRIIYNVQMIGVCRGFVNFDNQKFEIFNFLISVGICFEILNEQVGCL